MSSVRCSRASAGFEGGRTRYRMTEPGGEGVVCHTPKEILGMAMLDSPTSVRLNLVCAL